MKHLLLTSLSIASVILLTGCTLYQPGMEQIENNNISSPTTKLNEEQVTQLNYLIEEEKLAHDVYTTLGEKRNNKQFINIPKSEAQHKSLMTQLLQKYSITDPTQDSIGAFSDPELTELYHTLLTQGKQSPQEAIKVGIAIEQKDIADIEKILPSFINYPDIQAVLNKLLQGSRNHLKAFEKGVSSAGN
ncbi:hypothetical protein XF24_00483 [candidate division SR1 bacterium Aalborg_AAW-1]|nr:hypothetical protein XF24_00483 [candidate division SR1 bacterium Aalborg_AAW-1]